MKALLLDKNRELNCVEWPKPAAGSGEILLNPVACAVCRTDAVMWQQGHRDLVLPRIPGHEVCACRADNPRGPLYAVWPGTACGSCQYCIDGREHLCPSMRIAGFHRDGGFAECMAAPASSLIALPDGLSPDVATLAEPFGCALHAIERSRLSEGERVLVYGGGTLGQLLAVGCAERGADVTVIDPRREKLVRTESLWHPIEIKALTAAEQGSEGGFDVVINATSAPDTLIDGIVQLAAGGRFVLFSGLRGRQEYPAQLINTLHYREAELVGTYGCRREDMHNALGLIHRYRKTLPVLIEERIRLEDTASVMPRVLDGSSFKFVTLFQS